MPVRDHVLVVSRGLPNVDATSQRLRAGEIVRDVATRKGE